MQAWFNLLPDAPVFGIFGVVVHDTKKGAAAPATAAVRRNWRRDQGGGVEWGLEGGEEVLLGVMGA